MLKTGPSRSVGQPLTYCATRFLYFKEQKLPLIITTLIIIMADNKGTARPLLKFLNFWNLIQFWSYLQFIIGAHTSLTIVCLAKILFRLQNKIVKFFNLYKAWKSSFCTTSDSTQFLKWVRSQFLLGDVWSCSLMTTYRYHPTDFMTKILCTIRVNSNNIYFFLKK